MQKFLARFAKDESGATAIEYGLIAGLIGVAIITAVGLAGDSITAMFTRVSTELNAAATQ
ncbi:MULTISPECIES: Flp family type IVb pilin [Stappia]|uniref:Flp family type IVb pilin n=1 Tax=Stappia indica TaxID=538381 RepID=A0A857CAZ0_9HYPH|nr:MULTISPECIES: Flp family type IVb pilin [Stappia]MBC2857925.1 Flp family type IVb pilin [Stappia sp. 28M-7]QGZ36035.1 Flp family type IVb pilin [Stappia indica]